MSVLRQQIESLRFQFSQEMKGVASSQALEELRVKYLGKKGLIQDLMLQLKQCSGEERPQLGKLINDFKEEIVGFFDLGLSRLREQEMAFRLEMEWIDVTLPGRKSFLGRIHPIHQMMQEILDILVGMGFSVQYGPEVESDYYNFEGLNFAFDHPARDAQDTFYLNSGFLLRTHTTTVQVRVLETHRPPLRVVAPGRVFRNEDISARSHVFFHQVDGFYVDRGVTFADLLAMMQDFMNKLFGERVETRFRPSYFPFVEPGLEVDVRCTACKGDGCRLCKRTGWLEVLGAGMIHPSVFRRAGVDPEEYSGYAWGMGVERPLLLRAGIPDIRLLTENDLRFLQQFS